MRGLTSVPKPVNPGPQECLRRSIEPSLAVKGAALFNLCPHFHLAPCILKFWIVVKIKSNNHQWTQLTCIPQNGPVGDNKMTPIILSRSNIYPFPEAD